MNKPRSGTARLNDPGAAAHSAKNALAVPGLPNHSHGYTERTPMVGTDTAEGTIPRDPVGAAMDAYDFALTEAGDTEHTASDPGAMRAAVATALSVALDECVAYTPRELNTLVSTTVAGHLRTRADWHMTLADDPGLTAFEREWHASESVELHALADRVQSTGGGAR